MAPPTEGTASAAVDVSPPASASEPPTTAPQQAKTQSNPSVPVSSSSAAEKPHPAAYKSSVTPSPNSAKTSAAQALTSSAEALQLLSQQQEDYRQRLAQLQQQRASTSTTSVTSRVTPSVTPQTTATIRQTGTSTGTSSAMDAALRAQEDARRLQFALTQQQVQQFQAAKTPEEFAKLRQEKLVRMQQNVAALAAQAVQKRSSDEWARQKLLLEQEQLRVRRMHEQQVKQVGRGQSVTSAAATTIADSLLVQQQQVLRQQQMLQEMLQKQQQQQQHAELQRRLAQNVRNNIAATAIGTGTATSALKRTPKTPLETQMEALARLALRLTAAKTDFEMRQALDKMTSWLHRCTQLPLLQIAQRDFRDIMAQQRPELVQTNHWPMDLQVKSEYITQKIVQLVGVFMLREKTKAATAQASAMTVVNPGSSTASTTPKPVTAKAVATVPAVKRDADTREVSSIERDYAALKVQMQATQIDLQQKAKERQGAAVNTTTGATTATTAALTATHKRPLQVQIPASLKKPRVGNPTATSSAVSMMAAAAKPRPATAPISPRVAQQFYDLDLAMRACTETDDKMYLPTKAVAKIMQRVLPGACSSEQKAEKEALEKSKLASPHPTPSTTRFPTSAALNQNPIEISDDALTFMQECVTEFLLYFTSEARDHSILENRRTKKGIGLSISGANVIEGMENLGFTSYARVLSIYNEKIKIMQDNVAQRKWERKKQIRQQALQDAATAAAAAMAARAKAAGGLPAGTHPSLHTGSLVRPGASPSNAVRLQNPLGVNASLQSGVSTAARPVVPATVTRPMTAATVPGVANKTIAAAPVARTVPSAPVAVRTTPASVAKIPATAAAPITPAVTKTSAPVGAAPAKAAAPVSVSTATNPAVTATKPAPAPAPAQTTTVAATVATVATMATVPVRTAASPAKK